MKCHLVVCLSLFVPQVHAVSDRHDPALAARLLEEVRRQLHTEGGKWPLRYPHEGKDEPVHGSMTHNKAVRRMYQDRGLMPIPERQNYEALNQQRRRLGEQVAVQQAKLTQENTRPIRILPNYDLMYENKVRPNRVCFTLGAWVKRGNPESSAPSDESLATCHRSWRSDLSAYVEVAANLQNQDCWAVCGPEDTQTDINRECMIRETNAILPVLSQYLRVPMLENGTLKLSYSDGSYPSYFEMTGAESGAKCFADCAKDNDISALAQMPPEYCEEGVQADVILFLFKGLHKPGAAGYGGPCGYDQFGRLRDEDRCGVG